ncbi:hypothetical protein EWM64_g6943 [Hericium alpestre]|uniref:Uncharacterized protein n=1 Tax=Hericium alpestre TaxID=135208 RepID=A0A4Y9ZSN4_9AGAM|nr:hypothetical protein EWM64_g6943 [Hericium alpestre]
MSLTFYEPFYSLSDFDRLFNDAFNMRSSTEPTRSSIAQPLGTLAALRPRMDVHENTEKNFVTATFEFPGLKKEDVSIDVNNNILTVSGETKQDKEKKEEDYVIKERRVGKFTRSVPLPQGIKPDEIKAQMQEGVLTVTFPKSAPESAPKKITIK